jgi:predicted metal-binding protein
MIDLKTKEYVVVVQCDIVKQRCSGYFCEKAFNQRTGGFVDYPKDKSYRVINMSCGGCCGRAVHRKLTHLVRRIKKEEGIEKDRIVVHLSSCITRDNYHGPPCPHLEYIEKLVARIGLDVLHDTIINQKSRRRRKAGLYAGGDE